MEETLLKNGYIQIGSLNHYKRMIDKKRRFHAIIDWNGVLKLHIDRIIKLKHKEVHRSKYKGTLIEEEIKRLNITNNL